VATSLSAKSAAATGTGQALAGVAASGATKAVALSGVAAWLGGSVTVGVGVALVAQAISASPPPVATATDGEIAPAASSVVERLAPKTPAAPALRARESAAPPGARESAAVPSDARESAAVPSGARESAAVPSDARQLAAVPLSLEQEARALAEVQRALRDGRASEALVLLAEQGKRYKSGALGVERAAARALALCAAGRFTEARPLAERFSRDYAGSPLADRVRRNCLDRGRSE
jgi:hypothetical protein